MIKLDALVLTDRMAFDEWLSNVALCFKMAGTLGLACGLTALLRARQAVAATTLVVAVRWATLAWWMWVIAWSLSILTSVAPVGLTDQLWYTTAVLTICPFIAVLGARRPGIRVWTWFILVPLVLVLEWPAMAALGASLGGEHLLLEAPTVLGLLFIVVMGSGNYWGTRLTVSAALMASASMLLVLPMSSGVLGRLIDRQQGRLGAACCLLVASCLAMWMNGKRSRATFSLDRVWSDFRHCFGIVWARRIQDRVNQVARNENLAARLEMRGFVWTRGSVDPDQQEQTTGRMEHTLKWLLRRFVEPAWIEKRIQHRD